MTIKNFKTLSLTTFTALLLALTGCDKNGTPSNGEGIIGIDSTPPVSSGPVPLDENITIDNAALESIIASIFDNTPYSPAISVQGVINNQGLTVSVPYTVSNTPAVLAAYSTSVTLDPSVTENDESGIVATFSWAEQSLPVGSGTFTATITIDDSAATDPDNIYKAKRLDIEDDSAGLVAATFPYATNSVGGTGTLTLKIIPGILDRMFGVADNNDDPTTHNFLYLPVTNPTTGRTWLNNNLGANYANINSPAFDPVQQATASTDHNAYGSLFQWGRKADGHELITWTDGSTGTGTNGTIGTLSDDPAHALFITSTTSRDWRVTLDSTLWTLESSPNNVCPVGFRVPTQVELDAEIASWSSQNAAGALASPLALSMSGLRLGSSGEVSEEGISGRYWSTTPYFTDARSMRLYFTTLTAMTAQENRIPGGSVRCIRDDNR